MRLAEAVDCDVIRLLAQQRRAARIDLSRDTDNFESMTHRDG
jgi:hypothetical protein